ncbi:MAG TPA: cellulase family glycosylhydrolase [Chroococcales cyanobacterium]
MVHESRAELCSADAASRNLFGGAAAQWSGVEQLAADERKFLNDLNGCLVSSRHLPQCEIHNPDQETSNKTAGEHAQKRDPEGWHSSELAHTHRIQHQGWSEHEHRSNYTSGAEHSGGSAYARRQRHGEPNSASNPSSEQRTDRSSADVRNPKERSQWLTDRFDRDITNIRGDLERLGVKDTDSQEFIENLKKMADGVLALFSGSGSGVSGEPVSSTGDQKPPSGSPEGPVVDPSPVSSTDSTPTSPGSPSGGQGDTTPSVPISQKQNSPTGRFEVENGRLYGPDGKEFLPNGLNVDSHQAVAEADQLTRMYKFNFMRVGFNGVANSDGSPNFATLDSVANKYKGTGVVVEFEYPIADNQSVLTGEDLKKAENWYSQVAAHFKDNPYVFLATPNESGDGTTNNAGWLEQTKGIVTAISNSGNQNPIAIDDTSWSGAAIQGDPSKSQLIKNAILLRSIDPNLIAAEHDYSHASESDAAANLSKGISALQAAGYNPFIQEFGPYNFGGSLNPGGGVDAVLSKATMEAGVGYNGYVDTYGYSSSVEQAVAGPSDQDALIKPDGTLSDYGKKVVAQNQVDQEYLQGLT